MSEQAPPEPRVSIADPRIEAAEREHVADVLESGHLASGPEVDAFQSEYAAYCGTDRAVATANGTAALHAALHAAGVSMGDRVVTTPFSFVATANAIRLCNGVPLFADIDPETYNLDPYAVEDVIRTHDEEVEAIVAVHLYGLPAEMDHLRDIADTYDLALVEDAAQAHGATYDGQDVGSLGDVATFSFYPTKNMTTGEGGMVTTDDEEIADRTEQFINHGRDESGYEHVRVGHNFRMTDLEAAIGREQLKRLDEMVEARRKNASRLTETVTETDLVAPHEPSGRTHAYHQYTIRCADRDALVDHLDDYGIDTGVYYPTPIHEQPAYEGLYRELPNAEEAADEVLSLPVHPNLTDDELTRIESALEVFDG
ncbi:DegT/DnrJ/EryC1/StrS family aminotransferase [Haloarculaceae archaeon H-GB2-1]|nr:DegT/DnrJ/EryC1/StrS family aminotransferase [Haloarculaceae archaeon H-GB1-1]MEA5389581.1 DegT/DnrJ/EryC1/StrS family aminotransferase [Haloarculaceae archaeon H-GB11]MEA5409966.1 DegT/DnrJ/EryC1/StrS family aminotransferase [Haloarculaceae archaeon H-GB2-1]